MSDTNQWEKLNLQYSALKPEPHIYEASCLAYRGLAIDRHNQSILVTGEPGIGKTETVKLVLSHLANMRSTNPLTDLCLDIGEAKIVEKVDMSNPIWEAFGNTKTLRNDNSSHFGRLIQLYFERQGSQNTAETGASAPICILKGSKCDTYFLEKSRVVSKGQNERNYQEISSFRYLMEQHSDLDLSSTKKEWEQTKHSLSLFGISNEKLHTLMQALVTLLLGFGWITSRLPNRSFASHKSPYSTHSHGSRRRSCSGPPISFVIGWQCDSRDSSGNSDCDTLSIVPSACDIWDDWGSSCKGAN